MSYNCPRQSAVPSTSIRRPRALLAVPSTSVRRPRALFAGLAALLVGAAMMAPTRAHASGVSGISAFAGTGVGLFGGDGGPATSALLAAPTSVATDAVGNLYIADYENNRVRMVPALSGTYFGRVMSAGGIYTLAGTSTAGYSGDGGSASGAELSSPTGIAVDSLGNVYIADRGNQRVRMIVEHSGNYFGGLGLMAGGDIYTVAGNGTSGYTGDGAAADSAELGDPAGVAVDSSGNLHACTLPSTSTTRCAKSPPRTELSTGRG
jgi:trimeric autotransporter adhesin